MKTTIATTKRAPYWSKEAYLIRVAYWKEDIRIQRRIAKHGGWQEDRDMVKSLVASLKFHWIAFKVLEVK